MQPSAAFCPPIRLSAPLPQLLRVAVTVEIAKYRKCSLEENVTAHRAHSGILWVGCATGTILTTSISKWGGGQVYFSQPLVYFLDRVLQEGAQIGI
jgi:hypothetical protein